METNTLKIIETIIAEKRSDEIYPDYATEREITARGGHVSDLPELVAQNILYKGRTVNDAYYYPIYQNIDSDCIK